MRLSTLKTRQDLFEELKNAGASIIATDNDGATEDRYTIYFTYKTGTKYIICSDAIPFSPDGIWQHGEYCNPDDFEDKKIDIKQLPDMVVHAIIKELHLDD